MNLKIGKLSQLSGCPVVTIRFYEKEALLLAPNRSEANYRLYNKDHLERLLFILNCRTLNMSLDEIKILLAYKDKPCGNCNSINILVDKHIHQLEQNIQKQIQLKQQLSDLRSKCSGFLEINSCKVLEGLSVSLK